MPLDASAIYRAGQLRTTPFENLDTMMRAQEARRKSDEERRKAQAAQQMQEIWTTYGDDVPEALKRSYSVDPKAASEIEQRYSAARQNWAQEAGQSIKNEREQMDRSVQLLSAAKGDPELFQTIVPILAKRDQDFAAIAQTLEGPDDPRIDALLSSRDSVNNTLNRREKAVERFLAGDDYRGAAGMLATAATPEERAEMLQGFAPHLGKAQVASLSKMTPEQLERASLKTDEAADNAETVRSHNLTNQATLRGQDVSQATQIRGQDLSASTQRRGQDLSHSATLRGQNMTDARAKADAAAGGGVKLSAGQQQDMESMLTISDTAKEIREIGERTNWAGTGAFGAGTLGNLRARVGRDSADNMSLRNKVNNMRAAIAKMRGGTAFTPNEQALLDSYTPHINDGDASLKQKLVDLESFIDTKRKNMLKIASGDLSPNTTETRTETAAAPDLGGLRQGAGRRFTDGPYAGQTWTLGPNGQPLRVR